MKKYLIILIIGLVLIIGNVHALTSAESGGAQVFPRDSVWYMRIDNTTLFPPHANSNDWVMSSATTTGGVSGKLCADFDEHNGPFVHVVDNTTAPYYNMNFVYSYGIQSDFVPDGYYTYTTTGNKYQMPIEPALNCSANPQTPHIFQYCSDGMDRSMVVINPNTKRLYELFGTDNYFANPKVARGGLAMDLSSYDLRGSWWGTYKLDFDGLYHPLPRSNPGLGGIMLAATYITPGEIEAGEINHAMYLMVDYAYSAGSEQARTLWPARAAWNQNCPTGYHNGFMCPFYGARLRLKNTTAVNTWLNTNAPLGGTQDQRTARIIFTGLQKYGAFISDNSAAHTDGRMWHLQGIQNVYENTSRTGSVETRISNGNTIYGACGGGACGWQQILTTMPISTTYWEFVDESGQMVNVNSMQTKMGAVIPPTPPAPPVAYVDPYAGYVTPNLAGVAPLTITFTDISFDNPDNTTWSNWTFTDVSGNNTETEFSTDENPSYIFTAVGNYTIKHTVGNLYGYNTTPLTAWVNVSANTVTPPVANFTSDVITGRVPLTVHFTDTSTNTPTSWLWVFNDGPPSTAQDPMHVFSTAGTYTIELTATNAGGSDIETKLYYIYVTPIKAPLAHMEIPNPQTGPAPLLVNFTDDSWYTPTSWLWNFGDGSTSTLQNPSHTYATPGVYSVSITATNLGGSDTDTLTNAIYATGGPTPTTTWTPMPTPTPTITVTPTPIPTSSAGPQIKNWSSLTSSGINLTVSGITGDDVWAVYGQNSGRYAWITSNTTVDAADGGWATVQINGGAVLGNTRYYVKACDVSGCGNEISFSTAVVTAAPQTTFGNAYKDITGMR